MEIYCTEEIRQSTIYYAGLLGRWDKRIVDQESDVPSTVRPRDTRPQAARTSQVHVFELGPKKFEMNEFMK